VFECSLSRRGCEKHLLILGFTVSSSSWPAKTQPRRHSASADRFKRRALFVGLTLPPLLLNLFSFLPFLRDTRFIEIPGAPP